MTRPPFASGLLPCRARLAAVLKDARTSVIVAFWLFGLINNVLYVFILAAAQDLVGNDVPKGVVLLADVLPSFVTKLVAPYFIHRVPYAARIVVFVALSSAGMLLVALTPPAQSVAVKLAGVVLASLSSGGGELSFLGLTHYYGQVSLAAWGSGTGAAGLVGAGLYILLTDWLGLGVSSSLLVSAFLPAFMLLSFFAVLPRDPLRRRSDLLASSSSNYYTSVPAQDLEEEDQDAEQVQEQGGEEEEDMENGVAMSESLLLQQTAAGPANAKSTSDGHDKRTASLVSNLRRARSLFFPYMLPLLLVYIAEYTINQGVAPTLLFPLESSPFGEFRSFYPFYGFLYQLGVFIARSSTPFVRVRHLYLPSLLQVANLGLLTLQALLGFMPSVYLVFLVVFWEGLLGGVVYVNTFAEIMEAVPPAEREFSLGATTVSDSGGICIAGFASMALELWLCDWQVRHGRDWCRKIEAG